nr:hypothetical protein [Dyella sp. ASV24]
MKQVQWVAMIIVMLVGLGITRILSCVASVNRSRNAARPDWVSLTWAASIFLMELDLWWSLYDMAMRIENWTYPTFLMLVIDPLLLFFAAVMILPFNELKNGESYQDLYEQHGHWALLAIGAYWLEYVCENLLYWGTDPRGWWIVITFFLAALPFLAFASPRRIRGLLSAAYLLILVVFIFIQ